MKRTTFRLFVRKVTNWLVWFSDWLWEDSEEVSFRKFVQCVKPLASILPAGLSLSQVRELDLDDRIKIQNH